MQGWRQRQGGARLNPHISRSARNAEWLERWVPNRLKASAVVNRAGFWREPMLSRFGNQRSGLAGMAATELGMRSLLAHSFGGQCRNCTASAIIKRGREGRGLGDSHQLLLIRGVGGLPGAMALVMLMFPEGKTVKTLNPFSGPGSLKEERQQNRRII